MFNSGNIFSTIYQFAGTNANHDGASMFAGLLQGIGIGNNGQQLNQTLFGITTAGGANNYGLLFSFPIPLT